MVECQPGKIATVKSRRHDRVHRHDQRRRQAGQQQVSRAVAMPVPGRPAPAHGQDTVGILGPAILRSVTQGRQVGNQPDVPEQQRNRGIGRHGKHVPDQRTAPLGPERHGVGIRKQPVKEPRPPQVQERKQARAGHGEQGHRLGKTIDRGSPVLLEQQENRRDQACRRGRCRSTRRN